MGEKPMSARTAMPVASNVLPVRRQLAQWATAPMRSSSTRMLAGASTSQTSLDATKNIGSAAA